jgi:formate hydrogenlyase subunit 6/NADH:ubiquinone oxidoreductase subunit I
VAYRARVIQDVYSSEDDEVVGFTRDATICGTCRRCEDFCPTSLPLERIGVATMPDCVGCLYCWWACPKDAITLEGDVGGMTRQVARYKRQVQCI